LCFKGIEHMNKVVEANIPGAIADEVATKAEVVLIGYAGGGIRKHIRQQAAAKTWPISRASRCACRARRSGRRRSPPPACLPTVIAYNEVYNAIQNGVIAAGENEAAGVEAMKFYEVAPHLNLTSMRCLSARFASR